VYENANRKSKSRQKDSEKKIVEEGDGGARRNGGLFGKWFNFNVQICQANWSLEGQEDKASALAT